MIKRGYHYIANCDTPKCDVSYVVGSIRHNFEAKRQAKQTLMKEGWVMGEVGTSECPDCKIKREKKNDECIKHNSARIGRMEETSREAEASKEVT